MGELSGLRFDLVQIVQLPLGIDLRLASTAVLSDGHERPMLANPWRASRPDCGASSATTFVSGVQPCAGRDWIRSSVLPRAPASSRPAAGDAPRSVSCACTPARLHADADAITRTIEQELAQRDETRKGLSIDRPLEGSFWCGLGAFSRMAPE